MITIKTTSVTSNENKATDIMQNLNSKHAVGHKNMFLWEKHKCQHFQSTLQQSEYSKTFCTYIEQHYHLIKNAI